MRDQASAMSHWKLETGRATDTEDGSELSTATPDTDVKQGKARLRSPNHRSWCALTKYQGVLGGDDALARLPLLLNLLVQVLRG